MGFWTETVRQRLMEKTCKKKKSSKLCFNGTLTGRSGEERPDAQASKQVGNTCVHIHTQIYNIGPHCSALKGIIMYLALRSMGPSTDR